MRKLERGLRGQYINNLMCHQLTDESIKLVTVYHLMLDCTDNRTALNITAMWMDRKIQVHTSSCGHHQELV